MSGAEAVAQTLRGLLPIYAEAMRVRNYAPSTIETQVMLSRWFVEYCETREVSTLGAVTRDLVERYQRHLFAIRVRRGPTPPRGDATDGLGWQPLAVRGQHARLWAVVRFCRWCVRVGHIEHSPAAMLELPRLPRPLPKPALTVLEVEQILAMPNVETGNGLRDRAMMEVFYATGIRRGELIALAIDDVDRDRGVVRIALGKGRKGRIVPISARALWWIDQYVAKVWSVYPQALQHRRLFISADDAKRRHQGRPLGTASVTRAMGNYLIASGVTKPGACHIYRHTAATLMMENGADIRAIQDFLGHSEIKTTGIYTNVSFKFLKEQHAKTHPSAMSPVPGSAGASGDVAPTRADAPSVSAQPVRDSATDAPPL